MPPEAPQPVSEKPAAPSESPVTEPAEVRGAEVADAEKGQTPEEQIAYWRSQALAGKSAVEELNRVRREAAHAPSQPTVTPPTDPAQAAIAQYQNLLIAAEQEYQQYGTAGTALSVQNARLMLAQAQETWLQGQLMRVPEQHRGAVEKGIRERRYADADAALAAIQGPQSVQAELETLRKENERLQAAEKARSEGKVGVGRSVPIPASQAKGFVPKSISELNAELDRLERVDPDARYELSRRNRRGDFGVLPAE